MKKQPVTVVIPAFNEEKTISEVISRCSPFCDQILVVASPKSKDKTREISLKKGAEVILDHGKGKGDAIITAISHVSEGIIVFIDADGSHIPEDIPTIILINGLQKSAADSLRDGDTLSVFPPIAGG